MAYIPGYTYDIFISYAHTDNLKMPGEQKGWVELFIEFLKTKLDKLIGEQDQVKIWWDDRRLAGDILFDKSIEDGINKSAILIGLLSNGYLKSDYCKQEMNLFFDKSKSESAGASVGDHSRMIKVLLYNINHTKLPEQFGKATGFPFFKARDNEDYGESLESLDPLFKQQLKNITDSIVKIFEAFPKEKNETAAPGANAGATVIAPSSTITGADPGVAKKGFTIFFGEVSDSLRSKRKKTITELEKKGFTIFTNIPPPDEAIAHEQKVKEELQKADLAVHLLDQFPGREIAGGNNWYPKKQAELSLQLSPSKLFWLPAELKEDEVEEEAYRTFLQELEKNNNPENKFEFIRGMHGELAAQITDYAESIVKSRVKKVDSQSLSVMVDNHDCDNTYAYTLGLRLTQNHLRSYLNPYEDDPRKSISELVNRISKVNKLVFMYGNVSREYVEERVNAALQLVVDNNIPIKDFYVFAAPPNKSEKDLDIKPKQNYLKVNVMNNSNLPALNDEALDKFIRDMKGGNAA